MVLFNLLRWRRSGRLTICESWRADLADCARERNCLAQFVIAAIVSIWLYQLHRHIAGGTDLQLPLVGSINFAGVWFVPLAMLVDRRQFERGQSDRRARWTWPAVA